MLRRRADRSGQAGAEFLPQEPDHLAHALQREAPPAELADDGHGDEFVPTVDAPMTFPDRRHDAPFIPPLQLAGGDSGQGYHLVGCELSLHLERVLFQTKKE